MKYLKNRIKYLINEKKNWLDEKKSNWSPNFSKLMLSFHDNIKTMISELKESFNDKRDPDEIFKYYLESIDESFENLISSVKEVTDINDLDKFWNEFTMNLHLWKNSFGKLSKIDNYNFVFKLGYEIFNKMTSYNTKGISDKYNLINNKELDDRRENVSSFLDNYKKEILLRIKEIDPDNILSMSNLDEKDNSNLELTPGDEVRYKKEDGEENIAIVSHNQNELKEDDNVRLVSKKDGFQFEIDKKDLIEIIPKSKTINQEVVDKLKKIKEDPDKLNKLNDYLTDLNTDTDND